MREHDRSPETTLQPAQQRQEGRGQASFNSADLEPWVRPASEAAPSWLGRADKLVTILNEWILVVIGTTFTILIVLQVVARYAFQFSIFHINALSGFLLVWFVFVGVGLGFRYGMHASMDLAENLLRSRGKQVVKVLQSMLAILFFVFLLLASYYALPVSMRNINPSIGISFAWGVAAIPVGSCFALWHLAIVLRETLTGVRVSQLEKLADFGTGQP